VLGDENEPGNSGIGEKSLSLVEATFSWARDANPVQPLTIGVWTDIGSDMSKRIMELSDIVSFHDYGARDAGEQDRNTSSFRPARHLYGIPAAPERQHFRSHPANVFKAQDRVVSLGAGGRSHVDLHAMGLEARGSDAVHLAA
jgi:hypothetical protein